jgi:phosphoenolpyruvate carboxykinase (GTP)
MAMRPFCGYNMADYFAHWLRMGEGRANFPKVFHVNWFRTNEAGKFLWPGFGENMRVLRWIHGRVHGTVAARETPIGLVPENGAIDTEGLTITPEAMAELMHIDDAAWREEARDQGEFLRSFGSHTPPSLLEENRALQARLDA